LITGGLFSPGRALYDNREKEHRVLQAPRFPQSLYVAASRFLRNLLNQSLVNSILAAVVRTFVSFKSSSIYVNVCGGGLLTTKRVVEKIEGFLSITDGTMQVPENYKPHIDISPDTEFLVQ
jgi:hypothetical protein